MRPPVHAGVQVAVETHWFCMQVEPLTQSALVRQVTQVLFALHRGAPAEQCASLVHCTQVLFALHRGVLPLPQSLSPRQVTHVREGEHTWVPGQWALVVHWAQVFWAVQTCEPGQWALVVHCTQVKLE